jgi:tetratricopeptide (TPR) repeat protein
MYSIERACSLNNQGVDLLVTGDSSGAMHSLKMAMDIIKEAMIDGLDHASKEVALPISESPLTVPGLQGTPCYVYDHGIMIARTTTTKETSDEMLSLYSAIVLFNMALTCHHEGRLGRDLLALKRASLLYNMTVQILNGNIARDDTSAAILTLLALNNKAQIHYDQCEYIQCVDCFEEVLRIMDSVRAVHSTLSQKDIAGLLLNVILLTTPPTAAQAA